MIFQTTSRALARSALCGAALAFLAPGFTAQANDCANESLLKSATAGSPVELSFRNASSASRRLYWLDANGDRKFIAVVSPGTMFRQPTSAGHAWVVTDDAEKCLHAVTAASEPATIDVGGTQTVQIAPPAAGVAQPIAPPAAAPVVAQPAPRMQPAPAMAPPAAPMMAAAPPQNVAVQIPQVSPVAQFGLDGAQRIAAEGGSVLNVTASGALQVASVRPQFSSAHWLFEPVPGMPYVRIKNGWKGTYLVDANGALRAASAAPASEASHWTYEPVDGTPFIQFRNRASERFMLADRNAPALVDDFRQEQEPQSFWQVAPSAQAAPAVAAVNPAYAAAVANCREIGGIWTGSSCRAVHYRRPLACRPGWVWSPDFGECEWAGGGACPPWQAGPGGQCLADLTCTGGSLRASPRGLSCQCPFGMAAWGSYPRLSCVPALARILPLVVPAIAGANVGQFNRPSLGAVNQVPFGGQIAAPVAQPGGTVVPAATPPTVAATPPAQTPGVATATPAATTAPVALTPQQQAAQKDLEAAKRAGTALPAVAAAPPAADPLAKLDAATQKRLDDLAKTDPNARKAKLNELGLDPGLPADPAARAAYVANQQTARTAAQGGTQTAGTQTTVDPKTGVQTTTTVDPKTGNKIIATTDPKLGYRATQTLDPQGKQISYRTRTAGPDGGSYDQVIDPKTGITTSTQIAHGQKTVTTEDPKNGTSLSVSTDRKTGAVVNRTETDTKTGAQSVATIDPKTGVQTNYLYDRSGAQVGKTQTVKTSPGTTIRVDPKTGVATETTPDPKTGINAVKETNLKTGAEYIYKVDTKAAPPPTPAAAPNVTKPAPAATPAVATANPPVANAPGAALPKPAALPAVAATPPAIPPTGAAGAPALVGAVGAPAPTGAAGTPALIGARGAPAPTGAAGTPALIGARGAPTPTGAAGAPAPFGARGATAPTGAAGAGAAIGAPGAPAAPKPAAVATAPAGANAATPAVAPPAARPPTVQQKLPEQQAVGTPQRQLQRFPQAAKPVQPPQTAKPRPAPPQVVARPAPAPRAANPAKPSKCPQGQSRC